MKVGEPVTEAFSAYAERRNLKFGHAVDCDGKVYFVDDLTATAAEYFEFAYQYIKNPGKYVDIGLDL